MSLHKYFLPKKTQVKHAANIVIVPDNDSSLADVEVSSSSDEDPVYIQVVEKTRKVMAARNIKEVVEVDRSSVANQNDSADRQPVAVVTEPPRPTWSQRLAPVTSSQVLGNEHSVKELRSWLKAWKKRRELAKEAPDPVVASKRQRQASRKKKRKRQKKSNRIDSSSSSSEDDGWIEVDPDFMPDTRRVRNKSRGRKRARNGDEEDWFDNDDEEENQLCSMVLLTGPHGCGKTAAIFACAQELGYEVLEVNSASVRSGKQVTSLLHEATQSHQVSQKAADASSGKAAATMRNFFKPASSSSAPQGAKPDQPSQAAPSPTSAVSGFAGPSLILFEEVDILFEEDKGFWSALLPFAESSKRPIVLTSVTDCIPPGLRHLSFPMEPPAQHSVSAYLHEKCKEAPGSGGLPVSQEDISYGVAVCNGDLRRSLLQLEIWLMSAGPQDEVSPPTSSFRSWMSPMLDPCTLMGIEMVLTRQQLVEHSQSSEEVSPRERSLQLETTANLLDAQSVADTFAALSQRTVHHCLADQAALCPPSLSWQPLGRSWWPATLSPGLVDSVPEETADAIASLSSDAICLDIALAVGDAGIACTKLALGLPTTYTAKPAERENLAISSSDFSGTDSGIALGGDESLTAPSSAAIGTCPFSTLSPQQDSDFHSRRLFYSNCLGLSEIPDAMACQMRALAVDYLPMVREVCQHQQIKRASLIKRRFMHYFSTMDNDVANRLAQEHMLP